MLKILVDQDKNNQQMEQLKVTQIRSVIKEHNRKIEELYAKINGQKVALVDFERRAPQPEDGLTA